MIIELKGVEFNNKGAELMLHAIIAKIKFFWPNAKIAIAPSHNSSFEDRIKIGALQKLSLRKSYVDLNFITYYFPRFVRGWMLRWGIVTEADIDVILDAAGFSYSDQWGCDLRVRHAAAEVIRMRGKGGAYIFMPQAMGPFCEEKTKKIIKNGFVKANLVCARDDDTYSHLINAAGGFLALKKYGDFTNSIEGIFPNIDYSNKICFIPNHNMISDRSNNSAWVKSYVETIIALVEISIKRGFQVFFLNHEGQGDQAVIDLIRKETGIDFEVVCESNSLVIKGIIASSRLVICSRFHGCVSALSSGKPCLGTSWSHKYDRLFEEYEVPQLLLKPEMELNDLSNIFEVALDEDDRLKSIVENNAISFKERTESLWVDVKGIIDSIYAKK